MKTFTYQTKIAILRILVEIMNADKIIHENEVMYMNQVKQSFELDDDCDSDVNDVEIAHALEVIKELNPIKKALVAQMMGKMVVIDEDINYNEVILYNNICNSCNIDDEFNIDDYPNYSLSGPFA